MTLDEQGNPKIQPSHFDMSKFLGDHWGGIVAAVGLPVILGLLYKMFNKPEQSQGQPQQQPPAPYSQPYPSNRPQFLS